MKNGYSFTIGSLQSTALNKVASNQVSYFIDSTTGLMVFYGNGEYEQVVPKYSAVKINGKKLYEYARNEEEVVLPTRLVNVKEIEISANKNLQTVTGIINGGKVNKVVLNNNHNPTLLELTCLQTDDRLSDLNNMNDKVFLTQKTYNCNMNKNP